MNKQFVILRKFKVKNKTTTEYNKLKKKKMVTIKFKLCCDNRKIKSESQKNKHFVGNKDQPLDLSSLTAFISVPDFDKTVFIQFCLLRTLIIDFKLIKSLLNLSLLLRSRLRSSQNRIDWNFVLLFSIPKVSN